jgi:uncharacterized cupredoxin-like copper-binding protein
MPLIRSAAACGLVAVAAFALGGCSSDDGDSVDVTLADFSVTPDSSSTGAGDVTFKVKNNGTFVHELVVFKVADASGIPTKPSGEVNEDDIPEPAHMGEVEDIDPGKTATLKVKLDAGKYQLLCNRVDGKTVHFKKGMHADFTVTP